jgi:NitT/TauT family transport system permease protein
MAMSQSIPTVAIAPILVIWFGPGDAARLIVVFLIAFFPIVVNTTAGLLRADDDLVALVRGLNASRWKIFTKIRLPNALPYLFTGMRISIALSVIGAVVAEFVAATEGLGYVVFSGATNMDTKLVFAAVVILAVMGIVLFQLVRLAQAIVVPWAQTTREGEA